MIENLLINQKCKRFLKMASSVVLAIALVFSFGSSVFAVEPSSDVSGEKIDPAVLQYEGKNVSIIVELSETPTAFSEQPAAEATVDAEHREFVEEVEAVVADSVSDNGNYRSNSVPEKLEVVTLSETKAVFNSVAMIVPKSEVPAIAENSSVKYVWLNNSYHIEPNDVESFANETLYPNLSTLNVAGLHQEGLTGSGIKVAVLDTGIDYNHPDLASVYKGGWDFIDDDNDPMETTYVDWQASGRPEYSASGNSYYTSHGTHVAGTIAATESASVDYAALGVAPDVDLYAYRVLGPYGSGEDAGIVAAIEESYTQGMDVINLSLGDENPVEKSASSVAINNIARLGVVPVVSAGNSGPNYNTIGSPAVAPLAITVGASSSEFELPEYELFDNNNQDYSIRLFGQPFAGVDTLLGTSQQIVYAGLGKSEDFTGIDVNGKVALIKRGEIAFVDKAANAKANGAIAVIFYNNGSGKIDNYLGEASDFLPMFDMSGEEGTALTSVIADNQQITFGNQVNTHVMPGDTLASFSSRGGSNPSYFVKPEITAPGVSVLSTVPDYDGSSYDTAYGRKSGTSMAAPHVAGVVALMLQYANTQGVNLSVDDIRVQLMNSAVPLDQEYGVYATGAGRIDPYKAIHAETQIYSSATYSYYTGSDLSSATDTYRSAALQYGYTLSNETKTASLVFDNDTSTSKTYSLSLQSTTDAALDSSWQLSYDTTITVPANGSESMDVTIELNNDAPFGIYEGILEVTDSETNQVTRIPVAYVKKDDGVKLERLQPVASVLRKNNPFVQRVPVASVTFFAEVDEITLHVYQNNVSANAGETYLGSMPLITQEDELLAADKAYAFTWDGSYYDSSNQLQVAPEGSIRLEARAHATDNRQFSESIAMFIDNSAPELTLNNISLSSAHTIEIGEQTPVTTVDGKTYYQLSGKVSDSSYDQLNALGETNESGDAFSQGDNTVVLLDEGLSTIVDVPTVDNQGNFSLLIDKAEFDASNGMNYRLTAFDYFGSMNSLNSAASLQLVKGQSGGSSSGTNNNSGSEDITVLPQTGQSYFEAGVLGMILVIGGAVYILRKKDN
ncbi:S8 family serine peptidase [Culicoidibacter larvae]|uniref:LPXTG cell wall anchor domain-containing protein n=1 Tax=Culicoidibacter larvae TaxID=2579976 RepID=A0A5R8QD65_9FIRM|nr:S8 family serine peptidase [Culicoidibacter larvae]TLG74206.1 LPXTG cell wall anchor domain-containing protein [Culicoidibacter larvae]